MERVCDTSDGGYNKRVFHGPFKHHRSRKRERKDSDDPTDLKEELFT